MKIQKVIAVVMILTSSILTALVSGDIAFPAILCMLGLMGLQRRFIWDVAPEKRVITSLLLLLLAIMFALHYRYGSSTSRAIGEQAASIAWQTIARYFLASMILTLFLGSPQRLPFSLGLFHVAVTISAGQVLLLNDMYVAFRLSELFSVIMVVLYIALARGATDTPVPERAGRVSHRLVFGLTLLATTNLGWLASSILYRHVEVINYLPLWFWSGAAALDSSSGSQSQVGFSTSGKLSSVLMIKGEQDTTPMLSIKSDRGPGYLRARAFEAYFTSESKWVDRSNKEDIYPEQRGPFGMYLGRRKLFRFNKRDPSNCNNMMIRHESNMADAVFTPMGTVSIETPLPLLMLGDDEIVYSRHVQTGLNYELAYTKSVHRTPPSTMQERQMLDVPRQLEADISQLAGGIFAGCSTTTEKINAVVQHFQANYTYFLGLDIPLDRDKLTYFLLEGQSGYCEYFASGAAILLRLADVPTRYVTGFLVTHKDDLTGLWVARNMDAHAWVEAWDKELRQWTIVEATVGEDMGLAFADEQLEHLGGTGGNVLRRLVEALYQYGLFGVPSWLFESYGPVGGLLLPAILFGAALCVALFRRHRRNIFGNETQQQTTKSPELALLHKMLARMDRRAKAGGQRRDIGETLHAFSQRLRKRDSGDGLWMAISDWYVEYASLRYCKTICSKRLHKLTRRLHDSL
ncbi:MAG: transglutaminase domain-containing protein [Planctomycetota bacterium]|nr:transglutaminase domain-containing protein [Planctomycetota bacterium]